MPNDADGSGVGFEPAQDGGSAGGSAGTLPAPQAAAGDGGGRPAPDLAAAPPGPRRPAWLSNLRWLAGVLAAVFLIRTFVGEATIIPTSSMERTILVGDHVFLQKLSYGPRVPFTGWRLPAWKQIRRQDIIAFRYPRDPSMVYVKRAVGLGGDRIEIRRSQVYVNERGLIEPYVIHTNTNPFPRENFGPLTVPAGHVFVMGDNRDNSSDSRYWGPVPLENVIGEPLLVYWSYEAPSEAWLREKPMDRLRFYSEVARHFFSKTRWRRTGLLL